MMSRLTIATGRRRCYNDVRSVRGNGVEQAQGATGNVHELLRLMTVVMIAMLAVKDNDAYVG